MFKPVKENMTTEKAKVLWTYLKKWEKRLKRNVILCRIIQPLGACIFTLNMLLATMNLFYMIDRPTIVEALNKIPLLPSMVESFPRETWKDALIFAGWFAFLIPLAVSGLVLAVLLLLELWNRGPIAPLQGTEAQCAKALAHEAELVYQLRKKMPQWSIFLETTVLTALTAWPILSICKGFLQGDTPAILQISLSVFAMLVCLFVVFWVYAACFWIFAKLNSLYYLAPSQWKFWELFNDLDDYWESVDSKEYDRRERIAKQKGIKT